MDGFQCAGFVSVSGRHLLEESVTSFHPGYFCPLKHLHLTTQDEIKKHASNPTLNFHSLPSTIYHELIAWNG